MAKRVTARTTQKPTGIIPSVADDPPPVAPAPEPPLEVLLPEGVTRREQNVPKP